MAQEGRQRAIWGRLAMAVLAAACLTGCGQSEMDRADALMAGGKYAEAIAIWQGMRAEDPGRRVLATRIATAQARMGRLDLAAATLRQAIDCLPADPELHQNLGLVHLKQKDLDAALGQFERVLSLEASYPNTHYYIGLIHEMRGDETTARRLYVDEVNKGACLGAWDRLYELNQKTPRPRPSSRGIVTVSLALLAVAAAAYALRVYLDARQARALSFHGAD